MTTQSLNLIEKTLPILESVARAELLRLSQNSNNDQSVKTEIIVRGILLRIGSIRDQLRFSRDDLDGKPHLWKEIDIDAIIQKQKETSYQ